MPDEVPSTSLAIAAVQANITSQEAFLLTPILLHLMYLDSRVSEHAVQ